MKRFSTFFVLLLSCVMANAGDSLKVFYRIRLDQDIDPSAQRRVILGLEKADRQQIKAAIR